MIGPANVQRVLTFNFDLLVERTTATMGLHLPVYDFGVSPTKDINGLASPAIFHLHGQSYGLRLMNSDGETNKHAEMIRPILGDSLRSHLTIVSGYSGGADGAFPVMCNEFNDGCSLIWLGYSESPAPHLKPLFENEHAHYIGQCDFDRTMIELAQGLSCFPPDVIDNPPRHVLKVLKEIMDFPVSDTSEVDFLTATRRQLENDAVNWKAETGAEGDAQRAVIRRDEALPEGDQTGMTGPVQAKEKTAEARRITGKAQFIAACILALTGEIDKALAELETCLEEGSLPDRAHLEADRDLDALRDLPRFKALLESAG